MSDAAWKQAERRIAKFFGAERNSLSGGNSKMTRSDSTHDKLFIETKLDRQRSALHTLFSDTAKKAKLEEKLPVVVTQKARTKSTLITVHKDDLERFCKLFLRSKGYRLLCTTENSEP